MIKETTSILQNLKDHKSELDSGQMPVLVRTGFDKKFTTCFHPGGNYYLI